MVFTIDVGNGEAQFVKTKIMRLARSYIIRSVIRPNDFKLNNYLLNEYHTNLKEACLQLLSHCVISSDRAHHVIIKFDTIEANNLAKLITYGKLGIPGSPILKNALCRE